MEPRGCSRSQAVANAADTNKAETSQNHCRELPPFPIAAHGKEGVRRFESVSGLRKISCKSEIPRTRIAVRGRALRWKWRAEPQPPCTSGDSHVLAFVGFACLVVAPLIVTTYLALRVRRQRELATT